MKKIIAILFLTLFLAVSSYTPKSVPAPEVVGYEVDKTPVSFSVEGIEINLQAHPGNGFLPYSEEFAFYRHNGNALDVAAHCDTAIGSQLNVIRVGSLFTLTFADGSTFKKAVSEIILIRYESPSNPHSGNWIIEGDLPVSYTLQEITEFIMSKNAIVLHTSRCTPAGSIGQTFYIIPLD